MHYRFFFHPGLSPHQYVQLDTQENENYRIHANGTLEIRHAKEIDDGNYLCQAHNEIGHGISKIIHLTVHGK